MRWRITGSLLATLALACGGLQLGSRGWQTRAARDHPLVGKVWDVQAGAFTEPATVFERAAARRWVLLGEKHDNADHHRLQARTIRALAARGRRPALVFEMIGADQQPALDQYVMDHADDAAGLGEALAWNKSGWPPFELYRPIVQAGLDLHLTLVAADFPRRKLGELTRAKSGVLAELQRDLGIVAGAPAHVREALHAEIREAHCDKVPESVLPAMVEVQHARDAQLARALRRAGGADGAVLIAGNGHVSKGLAVPLFLGAPEVYVVAFTEVSRDELDPAAYSPEGSFDVLWFTPRVDDDDPCERFREQLERLGH